MRKRRSEEEWFEIVKGFDPNLMPLESYCILNNISKASYYVYKRKLDESSQLFLPVVIEEEVHHKKPLSFKSNGFSLEVSEDVSLKQLRLLLEATLSDL